MRDRSVFDILRICYPADAAKGVGNVKRVNLLEYFELAEALSRAKQATSVDTSKGGAIYVSLWALPPKLEAFTLEDNGFGTCKHAAADLSGTISRWISANLMPNDTFSPDLFEKEFSSWQYGEIPRKIDSFRSVFEAESHDVDVYSVGQVAIYKTQALVSNASHVIPDDIRSEMPDEALKEFDDAGRCLAFDLPTACGFHALRATELVIDGYLKDFGVTKAMKSWNDFIKAVQDLIDAKNHAPKPSPKVGAMLDRMRSLDRKPLMHPRDALDAVGANHLFSLCAITVAEMVKDARRIKTANVVPLLPSKAGSDLTNEQAAQ